MEVVLQLATSEPPFCPPALPAPAPDALPPDHPTPAAPNSAAVAHEASAAEAVAAATATAIATVTAPNSNGGDMVAAAALPPGRLLATAEFVMALRDSSLRRAVDVPPLHPRDATERALFRRGRDNNRLRQARRERDAAAAAAAHTHATTAAAPPAAAQNGGSSNGDSRSENKHAHTADTANDALVSAADVGGGGGSDGSDRTVAVRQTEVHCTVVTEYKDRNTSDTIFGGHLLRLAYDAAVAAAAAFAGAPCELLWLEEAVIRAPARVGDTLDAVGRVVWAEPGGRAMRVAVQVDRYGSSAPSQYALALTLAAAFLAPEGSLPAAAAAEVNAHSTAVVAGEEGDGGRRGLRSVVAGSPAEVQAAQAAQRRHAA
ncbi:hypothetical protein Agub_g10855, partial [Astrephomene gubernaculifera]